METVIRWLKTKLHFLTVFYTVLAGISFLTKGSELKAAYVITSCGTSVCTEPLECSGAEKFKNYCTRKFFGVIVRPLFITFERS